MAKLGVIGIIRRNKNKRALKHLGVNCRIDKSTRFVHPENIIIGDNFYAEENLLLQTWPEYHGKKTGYNPEIVIGRDVSMMSNCQISCMNIIEIGDGVLMGSNVFVTDNFHGQGNREEVSEPPIRRNLYSKGSVVIGNNVWIGRNACIMPNVKIGDGAIIGANAVVTHDIPDFSVAVGVPAKVIRFIE